MHRGIEAVVARILGNIDGIAARILAVDAGKKRLVVLKSAIIVRVFETERVPDLVHHQFLRLRKDESEDRPVAAARRRRAQGEDIEAVVPRGVALVPGIDLSQVLLHQRRRTGYCSMLCRLGRNTRVAAKSVSCDRRRRRVKDDLGIGGRRHLEEVYIRDRRPFPQGVLDADRMHARLVERAGTAQSGGIERPVDVVDAVAVGGPPHAVVQQRLNVVVGAVVIDVGGAVFSQSHDAPHDAPKRLRDRTADQSLVFKKVSPSSTMVHVKDARSQASSGLKVVTSEQLYSADTVNDGFSVRALLRTLRNDLEQSTYPATEFQKRYRDTLSATPRCSSTPQVARMSKATCGNEGAV